jgi:hypothetical protein
MVGVEVARHVGVDEVAARRNCPRRRAQTYANKKN